jgi:hypothetical protein
MTRQRGANSRQKLVFHHAVSKLDGGGEAFGISPAVAFDDDAV